MIRSLRSTSLAITILAILGAGSLWAGPLDPQGPEYLDIGQDYLYLNVPNMFCFNLNGHNDCMNSVAVTATGPVSDTYPGGNEIDSFSAQATGDLYDFTANSDLGDFDLTGLVELEVLGRSSLSDDGSGFTSEIPEFDFTGSLPAFGSAELSIDGSPLTGGMTSIEPEGNGLYNITSFFDVFFELTIPGVNGGTPTASSQTSTEVDVAAVPEPGSAGLAVLGGVSLFALFRRRRSA